MNTKIGLALVVAISALIAGCGGGGSGDGGSGTTTTGGTSAPTISTQPSAIAITSGGSGTLTVVASGSSLTYQWYKDSAVVSGATSSSLTVTVAGNYYVVVTNAAGSIISNTVAVTVTTSATALQTSVADPTYTSGSYEAVAFALVNSVRSQCGFGLVAQNTKLDTAAGWHAEYLRQRLLEGTVGGHTEDSSKSGYVATTLADRLALAGYSYSTGSEDISYWSLSGTTDYGQHLTRNLLATVYHLASMVNGNREAGVSITTASGAPSGYRYASLVWLNATASAASQQQTTSLVTYPCEGATGVQPYMGGTESPEPFTSLGFSSGTSVGHPIYFRAPTGSTLKLASATLTSTSGSVTVTLMHANDDPQGELAVNEAFVIPRAPLATNSTYAVNVTGTVDGTAFTKTFSFTTGSL